MNNVTDGLPADTGCSGPAILAPREAQALQGEHLLQGEQRQHNCSLYRAPPERVTSDENDGLVDLPAVARALTALDAALAEHGAPDPERTAAWLESEAKPAGAVFAVVPRG